ncbi:MAG: DNA repair exonuclease [Planctomycetota bacterium]|nr:DNA repair exonuclease [Planctomycetota bacterium]
MFKFIHAADIHLDSPLRGLEQYEGAPVEEIRVAARRALENLIDLAIREKVAFVLIAGDLYDGDWRDYNTGHFFVNQVRRLREADIPLYLISGNHDAANRMTRTLKMPENVTFFSTERSETAYLSDLGVAIHGQGFATAAVYDDLSEAYPQADSGLLNIGMLHTCAAGREGHDRYAPCSVEGLKSKGYDYWALGHIHLREVLSEKPFIAFSGNIQGRHVRETGPKGCLLVTVNDDRTLQPDFQPLDVLRWEKAIVDVGDCRGMDDVLGRVSSEIELLHGQAAGRPLAMRVELAGETTANVQLHAKKDYLANEIRSLGIDVGKGGVWIEKIRLLTTDPASKPVLGNVPDDALSEVAFLFEQIRAESGRAKSIGFDLADVVKKLPVELKQLARIDDEEWLSDVLTAAEPLLHSRLTGMENLE